MLDLNRTKVSTRGDGAVLGLHAILWSEGE